MATTQETLIALRLANEQREYSAVHEGVRSALSAEKNYIKQARKIIKNSQQLQEIRHLLEKETISDHALLTEACVLLFQSGGMTRDAAAIAVTENLPSVEAALGRLSPQQQLFAIDLLIQVGSPEALSAAGKCMVANGHMTFLPHFMANGKPAETYDKQIAYAVLGRLAGEEGKQLLEEALAGADHPLEKEMIALELIHQKSTMGRDYIKSLTSVSSLESLVFLSGPDDYPIYQDIIAEKISEEDEYFLEAYVKLSRWYQNPKLIPFYISLLKHKDQCINFSNLLSAFIYHDDYIDSLDEILDEWNEYEEEAVDFESSEFIDTSNQYHRKIIEFWEDAIPYLEENVDHNARYHYGEPFDILEIWKDAASDYWPPEMKLLHKGVQLLTGEYFPFDINGLKSTQIEQAKLIAKYLKKNRKRYPPGSWFYWGSIHG